MSGALKFFHTTPRTPPNFKTFSFAVNGARCAVVPVVPRPNDLVPRVRAFALAGLAFYRQLPKTQEHQVPGTQFYRAATGVDSNYRAAKRSRSKREFNSKLAVVVEEIDEVVGWLEYMRDGRLSPHTGAPLDEAQQLRRIFGKSLGTARGNSGGSE